MKRNLYDIFDHWNDDLQELPSLKELPVNGRSLTNRVMEKADIHPVQKKRKPYRMLGIIGAAAVLTGGTLTAGAISGKMDQFFSAVSGAVIHDANMTESLPAVNMELPDAIAQMQPYYTCPDVTFTQTDSAAVELLGMYNDHSSLMMSFQLTVHDNTILTEDMYMLPYFTLTQKNGTVKELDGASGYLSQPFQKSDTAENIYYTTYYLVDPELTGGTLHVDFAGVYTMVQEQTANEKMRALDDELTAQYFTEGMSIGEWKQFQHENNFDELRNQARREAFAEETAVLAGSWTADIPVAASESKPLTIETDNHTYILDDLSLFVSNKPEEDYYSDEADFSEEEHIGTAVFLKDGTVIADYFAIFDDIEMDINGGYILEGTRYQSFAYMQGTHSAGSDVCDGSVYCFSKPIHTEEIERIVKYTNYYDADFTEHINEYVIYSAE